MSYGFQPPNQSGPPPPYQAGAPPPSALSYGPGAPPQPGAPPYQPGAPSAPYQGAPPPYQPGAPPQGAPPQYAPFLPPSYYKPTANVSPQPGYQQGPGAPPPGQYERCAVIRHAGSGMVLDATEYEVKLQRQTGSPAQLWIMDAVGGGKYLIRNKGNGYVLDIQGGPDCGANLITYEKHGGENQQWFINNPDRTIRSAAANVAIDICEGNCFPGNYIIAWDTHGGANQQFHIQYQ